MIEYFTRHLIVRYVISGGTAAFVNLSIFSVCYYIFHIHYIVASIIAFIIAFFVSLILQKFWTFRDSSTNNIHIQGLMYLFSSLFGLLVNTFILYACVDYFGMAPLAGQIIAGVGTALCTFFISSNYIFKKNTT